MLRFLQLSCCGVEPQHQASIFPTLGAPSSLPRARFTFRAHQPTHLSAFPE